VVRPEHPSRPAGVVRYACASEFMLPHLQQARLPSPSMCVNEACRDILHLRQQRVACVVARRQRYAVVLGRVGCARQVGE